MEQTVSRALFYETRAPTFPLGKEKEVTPENVDFVLIIKPTRCTNFSNLFLE